MKLQPVFCLRKWLRGLTGKTYIERECLSKRITVRGRGTKAANHVEQRINPAVTLALSQEADEMERANRLGRFEFRSASGIVLQLSNRLVLRRWEEKGRGRRLPKVLRHCCQGLRDKVYEIL
jgi:hypothetical protein